MLRNGLPGCDVCQIVRGCVLCWSLAHLSDKGLRCDPTALICIPPFQKNASDAAMLQHT